MIFKYLLLELKVSMALFILLPILSHTTFDFEDWMYVCLLYYFMFLISSYDIFRSIGVEKQQQQLQ